MKGNSKAKVVATMLTAASMISVMIVAVVVVNTTPVQKAEAAEHCAASLALSWLPTYYYNPLLRCKNRIMAQNGQKFYSS